MASQKSTILIAGYYGFKNTGDEAILSGMLSGLRAIRPDLHPVVVSNTPDETAALHGVRSIQWTDLPAILDAAQQCDLVILGGGGLFADYWGTYPDTVLTSSHGNNSFYSGFMFLAALNDKPCMIYSVGVGPLLSDAGKELTRAAFDLCDAATVRDEESRLLVESLDADCGDIRVSADAAFNLEKDEKRASGLGVIRNERFGPLVCVALRNWEVSASAENWQKQVADAFDRFIEVECASLLFVPMQKLSGDDITNDVQAAERVIARMRHTDAAIIVRDHYSPAELAGLIAQCDLVVGMRLHSLIFGLKEAVPSVGIVYDPKVSNLMSRLGMQQYSLDLVTLTSSELYQKMVDAWKDRSRIRQVLERGVGELRRLAEEDARLAIQLLDGSKPVRAKRRAESHLNRFTLKRVQLLAERDQIIKAITESLAEKERTVESLSTSNTNLLASNSSLLASNTNLLASNSDLLASNSNLLAENKNVIQTLTESENAIRALDEQHTQLRITNESMTQTIAEIEDILRTRSEELVTKEAELNRIKSSLAWRILTCYGRIKHGYFLPLFRRVRLESKQTGAVVKGENEQRLR